MVLPKEIHGLQLIAFLTMTFRKYATSLIYSIPRYSPHTQKPKCHKKYI